MNTATLIRGTLPLQRHRRRPEPGQVPPPSPPARIARLARLMALARHVEELVRSGTLGSYAAAARLGQISRARLSQILGLVNLAPDLQEHLLFLETPARGRPALGLRQVLTVAAALNWDEQRRRWRHLQRATRQRRTALP